MIAEALKYDPVEVYKELRKCKKNNSIITVAVRIAQPNAETGTVELIADYKCIKVLIPKAELDDSFDYRSVVRFVGQEVKVVVLSVNASKGQVICSRAGAQRLVRPEIVKNLASGKEYAASVINIFPHGAYIDIDGVTGVLKNYDFSNDATAVREVCSVGDKVNVRLKQISETGVLQFEMVDKYCSPDAIDPETIAVNQIILGTVRGKKPWGIFVNIAHGLDVLTSSDVSDDIQEDQKVRVKVLKVYRDEKNNIRIRGVIKSVVR